MNLRSVEARVDLYQHLDHLNMIEVVEVQGYSVGSQGLALECTKCGCMIFTVYDEGTTCSSCNKRVSPNEVVENSDGGEYLCRSCYADQYDHKVSRGEDR